MHSFPAYGFIVVLLLGGLAVGCEDNKTTSVVGSPAEIQQYLKDNQDAVRSQKEILARRIAANSDNDRSWYTSDDLADRLRQAYGYFPF